MPKLKTYYVVDNVIIGANHIINNAGCINLIQQIDDSQAIIKIYAEETHLQNLKPKLNEVSKKTLEFNPITVVNPAKKAFAKISSWLSKLKSDKKFIKQLFGQATADHPEFILFCTITAINLYRFMHLIGSHHKQKVLIGLHGEIEFLFMQENSYKNKLNAYFYKQAFASVPENVKFLVLSPLIKDKIVASGLLQAHQIICIQHPINEALRAHTQFPTHAPLFAQLGVASLRKNSQVIFDLGARLKDQIVGKKVSLDIIGKVAPDTIPFANEWVHVYAKDGAPIKQLQYEQSIMNATYSLSFITGQEYVYRISGSIMDSIQYQLPIIALKHDFINDLFTRAGDVGFLCNNVDEMALVIDKIIQKDSQYIDRYTTQIENLKRYAQQFYDVKNVIFFKQNLASAGWTI